MHCDYKKCPSQESTNGFMFLLFRNPGCNGMCSMCYRKFAHTQPSKDPAPGTAASDLKVPATMPEGQPTKSLHSPHPSSSPDHANQALQSNISMAVPKTLLDDLPSQVVTGTPVVPERGCESSQPEKMEVDEQEVHGIKFMFLWCLLYKVFIWMCKGSRIRRVQLLLVPMILQYLGVLIVFQGRYNVYCIVINCISSFVLATLCL